MSLCPNLKSGMFAVTYSEQKNGQNYLFAVINYEQKKDNIIMLDEAKKIELMYVSSCKQTWPFFCPI